MKRKIKWGNVIILLAMMVVAVVTLFSAVASLFDTLEIIGSESYLVQSGDTLWSIAKMSNGNGHLDVRTIINDIKALSNCTSDIMAGDIVQIPIYA